jgi:hypothetical protein
MKNGKLTARFSIAYQQNTRRENGKNRVFSVFFSDFPVEHEFNGVIEPPVADIKAFGIVYKKCRFGPA